MDEAAIRTVIQQAQSVDPQLKDRWIVNKILAAMQPITRVVMSANAQTPEQEIDAGYVEPGAGWFEVIHNFTHKTLRRGDTVQVVEDPSYRNWIYRQDGTLHGLQDDNGRYVALRSAPHAPRKEGLPTTGAPHCPSTGLATQPHQRQEHLTTTWLEPPIPLNHPHGADYARSVYLTNAAEGLNRTKNEILFTYGRLSRHGALAPEDIFLLNKAVESLETVIARKHKEAEHFGKLAFNPEPAATPLSQ